MLTAFDHNDPILAAAALWHSDPAVPRNGYAVLLFRYRFTLDQPIAAATCWLSASQRFELYLDGRLIARGPSRSDPMRWLVSHVSMGELDAGRHLLAVRVLQFGEHAGIGQMGGPGFLLVHGEGELEAALGDTDKWRCCHDRSIEPLADHAWDGHRPYFVVGSGERIAGEHVAWGWTEPGFDDSGWPAAKVICRGAGNPWGNLPLDCLLRPDPLPLMEERPERLARIAAAEPAGLHAPARQCIAGNGGVTIDAHSTARLVLDRGELTNAYPVYTLSGGRDSHIRIVAAEAPYTGNGREKGHRDHVEGMTFRGHLDEILPEGGRRRVYTHGWFRSFRYLELAITTGDEPLTIDDVTVNCSGYPLEAAAGFETRGEQAPAMQRLWDVSWRSIRLCAHETFFDCPHYEQAQFPGDTRVQAVYHYLVADDDRLARKAIDDFHASRLPSGLTQCRYPSRRVQILPTFSLYWIGMCHDLRAFRGATDMLAPYMPAMRAVCAWFERRLRPDGMLGRIGHAPFIDWTDDFHAGNAPQENNGGSALLTLLFAQACGWVSQLELACGNGQWSRRYKSLRKRLTRTTIRHCWDTERKLVADTTARRSFSVHTQVQAVLAGSFAPAQTRQVLTRALEDETIIRPGTHYYRYYLAQALRIAGMGEKLFELLDHWYHCLENTGLTTWPETDRLHPRSDCHAWSVTPAIEMLQTVLGIEPDVTVNGFTRAWFRPTPGPLECAAGTVSTPHGPIRVELESPPKRRMSAKVETPIPLRLASGKTLEPGEHRLQLPRTHAAIVTTRWAF